MPLNFTHIFWIALFTSVSLQTLVHAATSSDGFVQSRAAYYTNSEQQGTATGACEFGSYGATVNNRDVSAVSDLYRNGVGCGACYQVKCTDIKYCSGSGVTVVITDSGSSDRTDFILSQKAFGRMAQTAESATHLLSLGVVDIEYRRVSCSYPGKNIMFKIDANSNNPHYLALVILYQQGNMDIIALQLCETHNFACKLLDRGYGAMWTSVSPPTGNMTIRMLFSGSNEGDEFWVIPVNHIPYNWKSDDVFDSGVQVSD